MSKDKGQPKDKNYSDKGKNDSGRGKSGWINEGQSDYDKIRKGAEVTPRPEKPRSDGGDKK